MGYSPLPSASRILHNRPVCGIFVPADIPKNNAPWPEPTAPSEINILDYAWCVVEQISHAKLSSVSFGGNRSTS